MNTTSFIDLKNISHSFNSGGLEIRLFEALSLRLKKGDVTSIIGASGTGKSSLLSLAAGLETPVSGRVHFVKDSVEYTAESFRQHIGFIFQQFHLLPEMDALNNLALPVRLKGKEGAFDKALEWLSFIGLKDRAAHKPSQLSGGEQQRVAIARAFISAPDFIFADEPTGNLDVQTAQNISRLMLDCAAETGCGLVLVTHSNALAQMAETRYSLTHKGLEKLA